MKRLTIKIQWPGLMMLMILAVAPNAKSQSISDCYSRATVVGKNVTGGLVGQIPENADVHNTYSTGLILYENSETAGGLIALAHDNATVRNSYWDRETAGISISSGGFARTTDKMTYPYDGSTYLGWSFSTTWQQDINGQNRGYPFLQGLSPELYDLSLEVNNPALGTVTGGEKYSNGATVFAEAQPGPGIELKAWQNSTAQDVSQEAVYRFYMPAADYMLTAVFDYIDYIIDAQVDPPGSGQVSGTGTYHIDDIVTLTATANQDYRFVEWTDTQNQFISSDQLLELTVEEADISLVARFELKTSTGETESWPAIVLPNPFGEFLYISTPAQDYRIVITDLNGKLVYQGRGEGDYRIDARHLPEGYFTLNLFKDNKRIYTQKLLHIIQD